MDYKVFAVNCGSTSTKIALFQGERELFRKNVEHAAQELNQYPNVPDQLPFRTQSILALLGEEGVSLTGTDAFAARGGGLVSVTGGVYEINETLLHHARIGFSIMHPATLSSQIADGLRREFGGRAFVVNPPDVDEFQDLARVTGFSDVYRESRVHALNHKEVAMRYCEAHQRAYEKSSLIVAHIGGGISVVAHRNGLMIDGNDNVQGDGPMAPTRAGALPAAELIKLCFSGKYTQKELYARVTKNGGFVDHLGTSDAREVAARAKAGDEYANLIYEAMIYQIGKAIGSCAAVLHGKVDGILLTGGMAHDSHLTEELRAMVGFIAPVEVIAGEFEMEALNAGAQRVLSGREAAREYTGIPVWNGFSFGKCEVRP